MSTPFLYQFTVAVMGRLLEAGRLELAAGHEERAVQWVAGRLGEASLHSQLIPALSAALLACPDVVELYADEAELKEVVGELGT